jgi:gentisate 1,2-dioxygenase
MTHLLVPPDARRRDYYERIARYGMTPLWEVLGALVPPTPATPCVPAQWKYRDLRNELLESGELITAAEAERRVLILENPGMRGASCVTHSLYAGLQLIMPGEVAPSHRHTQTALRFVIEGTGAYTAVDGERVSMHPGDFIITPSWTWHDHGNPGNEPVVWLDGLDIPLVAFFDSGFMQRHPQASQPVSRAEGDSAARYGSLLMPVGYSPPSLTSPVFCYPYSKTRSALDQLRYDAALDPCHGVKMQYTNPATGGHAMPTMGAFIQWLPGGFRGAPYRSTDATVYCAVEGRGVTHIADKAFEWQAHDVFVAPSWSTVRHEAAADAVLFSFSDRPAQQALGLWREEAPLQALA